MARLGLLTRGVVALFQLVMSFQLHPDPLGINIVGRFVYRARDIGDFHAPGQSSKKITDRISLVADNYNQSRKVVRTQGVNQPLKNRCFIDVNKAFGRFIG